MVSSRLKGVERVLLEQNPWFTNGVPSLLRRPSVSQSTVRGCQPYGAR
jgi:hypothetical protein